MEEAVIDHVYVTWPEACRRYKFELDRPVEKEKLLSFVSRSASRKHRLAYFSPMVLNFLYQRIATEIETKFNVHVKTYVCDGVIAQERGK